MISLVSLSQPTSTSTSTSVELRRGPNEKREELQGNSSNEDVEIHIDGEQQKEDHEKRKKRRRRRRKTSKQASSSSSNGTPTKNNDHRSLDEKDENNKTDDEDGNDEVITSNTVTVSHVWSKNFRERGLSGSVSSNKKRRGRHHFPFILIPLPAVITGAMGWGGGSTTNTNTNTNSASSRCLSWKQTTLPSVRTFFLVLLLTVNMLFVVIHNNNYHIHHKNATTINTKNMYTNNRRLYTFESYSDGRGGRLRRYLQDNTTNIPIPEFDPSFTPTIIPNITASPSGIPTSMPTISASPTISPQPTGQPTISPSLEPSSSPTDVPTTTFAPTSPSAMPSESFVPTVSPAPTTSPTVYPTVTPTLSLEPSGSPVSPSQQPSLSTAPTMSPSSQPTGQPTQSIQPSISPSISFVPTLSGAPSSSPTTFTPAPTYEMRNDTSPVIVMVLDGVPGGFLSSDEEKAIWRDVTSQHVMDFHNRWMNSFWDEGENEDGGDGTPSPSTINEMTPSPTTFESNQTMIDSEADGGGDLPNDDVENDDDIPIMMPPSTRQSSPTSISSGSDNGNSNNNNDNSSLSPFDVVNVTTSYVNLDVVKDTEGSWPNTSVVRIYYTQEISYVIKNPDLIPNSPPESDDEMGDTGVEATQRAEYEEFRDEFLFILPFKSDSFDYSVALVDALDLESFVIVDSVEIDTGPTPAPTPAPVPEASSRAVAWSASLVVGACIIVAFLMWDRHRKNAKFKYDGDDDDEDDENGARPNSRRDYNTADFDNAGQPVDWTNPYSDPGAVEVRGESRHRSRHSGAGFSAGESSVSSGERMRPPRSSGGTPGRGGNSNYGTATFSDDAGREGALNTGTFGTFGTLTTVMSSAGPTPQGSNRERDRVSDRRSGGRGAMDPGPNLPPLPLPRGEHVRTGTWSSAYETTGSSSNHGHTRSSSGWSRGSGAYGSPVMIGHRLAGRQTSIADTELTDLTFSDSFTPTHPSSGTTFTSLNDLPSAQKFGPSDQQISTNSSAPLHIPDDDAVPTSNLAAENLDPSSVIIQQSIPQPLDLSSNGGIDDREFEEDSPQPAITGFAMQIEDLE